MAAATSSWADLQPELLGLVLGRLPSLADRVRLAAVCRPWRRSARLEPGAVPPPFPWLTLRDCTFLSIPDGKIYCLPLLPPGNSRCHGSVGSWLFLEHGSGYGASPPPLSLTNPFSRNVMHLPDADAIWRHEPAHDYRGRHIALKMVLLSAESSMLPDDHSLFAVLITDWRFHSVISICQPSAASAFRVPGHEHVRDIALVGGKLYALSDRKLFVLDELESSNSKRKPKLPSMKCIANDVAHITPGIKRNTIAGDEYICGYWNYLVESNGRLLHVRRVMQCLSVHAFSGESRVPHSHTFSFEVFEVDLTTTSSSVQWRQLSSLGGQALFVGPYSKALQASECGGGAQADCIYFICDYGDFLTDPFRDCGVFNMRNKTITPLFPETTMVMQAQEGIAKGRSTNKFYSARPSWFFPY